MKLAYSNWHKELVHDENIQSELSIMTKGELEFNNRPFVKHRTEREEFNRNAGGYRKNFGGRDNRTNSGRDNRGASGGRDNRNSGGRDNRNNNNRNFKKRY